MLTLTVGVWQAAAAFSYQWRRGGAPIPGADAPAYLAAPEDAGQSLSAVVTAENGALATQAETPALIIAPLSSWHISPATAAGFTILQSPGLSIQPQVMATPDLITILQHQGST